MPSAAAIDEADAALSARVTAQLGRLRDRLGPLLAGALDTLFASFGADVAADPILNFTRVAQPVIHLPAWIAGVAAARGRPAPPWALDAAVESAVTGYLCAQAQDGILDGEGGVPERRMLLAHALFTRHQTAVAKLAGDKSVFWALYEEKWLAYGEALALERSVHRGDGCADARMFDAILRRSHPLMIPGAALLAHLDLWDLHGDLERLVRHSTRAAQLFDDLLDATGDLEAGNRTWVVRRLGGDRGVIALRRAIYLEGGFERVAREAEEELLLAGEVALAMELPAARAAFDRDRAHMEGARREVVRAMAQQLFG